MGAQCLACDRDAGHRYACHPCVNRMRQHLRDIEDYVAIILSMRGAIGSKPHGSIGVSFGSKPPVSLTALALLDPRSTTADDVERNSPEFDPVGADEHDHIRSLPTSVHAMAAWVREEQEQSEPSFWTLVSELRYLATTLDWCAQQQWVDELHSDIRELHSQARSLAKDKPSGPLGHCLSLGCVGVVFPATVKDRDGRHDGGRCDTCQRSYTGLDLVRLGVSEEAAG